MINLFEFDERDLKVFNQEIRDYIPDKIIDNHIHIWERKNVIESKTENPGSSLKKPWFDTDFMNEFTYNDFRECINTAFPNKNYEGIFFGLPLAYISIEKTNQFVINSSNLNGFDFLYIPLPDENIWETNEKLNLIKNERFLGFKPYPDLMGVEDNEISIFDFLNRSVLEFSNEHELIIVLHLPRKDKLRSASNIEEIIEILKNYKKIKLILAHAGRSFCVTDIKDNIDLIKDYNNIFFDLALINEYQVFELLIKKIDIKKIIFGTDYPMGLAKGKDVCINNNHYYVTNKSYKWGLVPSDPKSVNFTLYAYEEIRSLLYAINNVKSTKAEECLNKIFYENFENLRNK